MLILLVLPLAICLAVWAAMLAWRGNWKAAAIALGSPLLLAIAIAALAMSGALDSGHSEDWGPLMALLLAGAMAMFSVVSAVAAGIVGFIGHRQRAAALDNTF